MAFYDGTPTGRIINRFSHDIAEIDTQLGVKIQDCLEQILLMTSALSITVYLLPQLIFFLIPIGFVYRSLMNYYRATNRDIKRLESVSRSPLYAHFSESLAGLTTIRGYNEGDQFAQQNQEYVERYVQASTYQAASRWWLGMRIDGLSASLSFLVTMFATSNRDTLSPAVSGLLLVQTTKAIQNFRWVLKRMVDVESAAVCLERVMEYTDLETPQYHRRDDPQVFPSAGNIVFDSVCMRYRPGLPLALDEASFELLGGESVGVCGRTGAGKSTIANAIFRMVELSSGQIIIDGHDISGLGLETLRKNLGIVPQDPAMFSGDLRTNLDPLGLASEWELWAAIERVQLQQTWKSEAEKNGVYDASDGSKAKPLSLEMEVAEGGSNISVGQRQLVCLARALLRSPRLLILDEATASIDIETDRAIQRVVRSEFDATSLTIAHRLDTIMDCDSVLVLAAGKVVEHGEPRALAADPHGVFYSMIERGARGKNTVAL